MADEQDNVMDAAEAPKVAASVPSMEPVEQQSDDSNQSGDVSPEPSSGDSEAASDDSSEPASGDSEPPADEPAEQSGGDPVEQPGNVGTQADVSRSVVIPDPVEQAHADHASAHGLEPGATYAVSQHGETTPFLGTLVGSNELGVLMKAWGGKIASFHPWASIRSLIHQ